MLLATTRRRCSVTSFDIVHHGSRTCRRPSVRAPPGANRTTFRSAGVVVSYIRMWGECMHRTDYLHVVGRRELKFLAAGRPDHRPFYEVLPSWLSEPDRANLTLPHVALLPSHLLLETRLGDGFVTQNLFPTTSLLQKSCPLLSRAHDWHAFLRDG